MKHTIIAFALAISLFSCKKKEEEQPTQPTEAVETVDIATKNDQEIQDYLTKNNLKAEKTASGLYYIINEAGAGAQPKPESEVTVAYKGYFTNGTVFDQSGPEGISFGLQQVIKGWTEGITYFKKGGSGVLLIPSTIGYGDMAQGPIPGGSVLIFDIKLIDVK